MLKASIEGLFSISDAKSILVFLKIHLNQAKKPIPMLNKWCKYKNTSRSGIFLLLDVFFSPGNISLYFTQ